MATDWEALSYKDGRDSASKNASYAGVDVLSSHSGRQEAKRQQHDSKQAHNDAEYHENYLYVQQPKQQSKALWYSIPANDPRDTLNFTLHFIVTISQATSKIFLSVQRWRLTTQLSQL